MIDLSFNYNLIFFYKFYFSFICFLDIVVDDLIFDKHIVLEEVFSQFFLFFVSHVFELIQFFLQMLLDLF